MKYLILALLSALLSPLDAYAQNHPQTIYMQQGGKKMVVQSGATLQIDSGAIVTAEGATLNNKSLSLPGRARISICGDATTVNNNTVYYGPSQVVAAGGLMTCNIAAAGSATEATADAPAFDAQAFQVLSMDCHVTDPGATVSFTLRSAAAATTPSMTCSIADNGNDCFTSAGTTTAIASGATVAIAAASTADMGAAQFVCNLNVAY